MEIHVLYRQITDLKKIIVEILYLNLQIFSKYGDTLIRNYGNTFNFLVLHIRCIRVGV